MYTVFDDMRMRLKQGTSYITHWLASHFCFSLLSVSLLATLSIIYIFMKLAEKHTSSLGCTLKKLGKVYRGIYTTG